MMVWWGLEERAGVGSVKQVSFRLDIHDHCRRRARAFMDNFERGLESESPCSVSGEGFPREITFHSFSTTHYNNAILEDGKLVNRLMNGLEQAGVHSVVFCLRSVGFL
jgi:glutamate-1-semialdehyde aminotransferase